MSRFRLPNRHMGVSTNRGAMEHMVFTLQICAVSVTYPQHTLLHTPRCGASAWGRNIPAQHTLLHTLVCAALEEQMCRVIFRVSHEALLEHRRGGACPTVERNIPRDIPCYIAPGCRSRAGRATYRATYLATYPRATYPATYPATYLLQTPVPRGSLGRVFVDTPICSDTDTQRHRNTETHRHRDTPMQRRRHAEVPRCRGTEA